MADQYTAVAPRFDREQVTCGGEFTLKQEGQPDRTFKTGTYRVLVVQAFGPMAQYLPEPGELAASVQASLAEALTEAEVKHHLASHVSAGAPAMLQEKGKDPVKVYSHEYVHLYESEPVIPAASGKPAKQAGNYMEALTGVLKRCRVEFVPVEKARELFMVEANRWEKVTEDLAVQMWHLLAEAYEEDLAKSLRARAAKAAKDAAEAAASAQEAATEGTEPLPEPEDAEHQAALVAAGV